MDKKTVLKLKKKLGRFFSLTPHRKYLYTIFYKYFKVQNDVILLESFNGETINDSSLVFAREIQRLYPGRFKVYFSSTNVKLHKILVDREKLNVKLVDVQSAKYLKLLATAKYFLTNASTPTFYTRRPEQLYLQTWHGTPLKTLGKQMKKGIDSMGMAQHGFLQSSHLLFPNEFTRKAMMEDYNLEKLYTGKVVMSGYPRNQVLMQKEKSDEIRSRYDLEGKTVYAYLPTWRGTSPSDVNVGDYINKLKIILHRLDKRLSDDQLFYVNLHHQLRTSISFDEYTHIREFPKDVDTYSFLNASDALVTDYSSVMFDYVLTRKPILLFMYDYDQYIADRGLYLDIKTLPFRQIFDEDEFYDCISSDLCLSDSYEGTEFFKSFTQYEDVNNPERLLRMLIENDCTGLEMIDYSSNKDRRMKVYLPEKIDRESDFETFSKIASDDDSVVLMQRKWLKGPLGDVLYEKYRDRFNFVILANIYMRTYIEMLLYNLGFRGSIEKINDNNIKRCFGELNIAEKLVTYGCFEDHCQVNPEDTVLAEATLGNYGPGCLDITLKDKPDMNIEGVVILDEKNTILFRRAPEKQELDSMSFHYDFTEGIRNALFPNKSFASAGLIASDGSGNLKLVKFTDRKRAVHVNEDPLKTVLKLVSFDPVHYRCKLPVGFMMRKRMNMFLTNREEDAETEMQEVYLVPGLDVTKALVFTVSNEDKAIEYSTNLCELLSISCRGSNLRIKARLSGWSDYIDDVRGICLDYHSKIETITLPMQTAITRKGSDLILDASITLSPESGLKPVNWGVFAKVRYGDKDCQLRIATTNYLRTQTFYYRNLQVDCGNDYIFYPYINKWDTLKFVYRQKSPYDSAAVKAKEIAALIVSPLAGFFLKNNVIIFEKFCQTAQDNSYYFFLYCMNNLSEEQKKRVYYVIDKASADYEAIKKYDRNIIQFMSFKHMVYCMAMKACVSTDAKSHLYTWQSKPSKVFDTIKLKPELFLQHGVLALKRVENLFGKRSPNAMMWFAVSSQREKDLVVRDYEYKPENVPITGLTRWDVLKDKRDPSDRFILIMPTWRAWLEDATDEQFQESEYYHKYVDLITNKTLLKLLKDNGLYAVLYLHPKFAQYIESFSSVQDDLIKCIPFGQQPLNDIMMRAEMLITDYSSVCWDMLFMDKPVIYYQFDRETYLKVHGAYIDLENGSPSDSTTDGDEVIGYLKDYVDNGFRIKDKYVDVINSFYTYKDTRNSQRTYEYLMRQLAQL